jgi:tetratricopeptide (TPR) repeat protein
MTARAARHAAFVLLALLASLRFTAGAAAAPSEAQRKARAHFQTGEERFKAGAFADALAAYQAGYDVLPLPGFLINVAQCQRRLGDLKTARATYQKFVLVAPDSPLVPQVKSMIAEIDGLLADLDKNKPAAAPADPPKAADEPKPIDEPSPAAAPAPAAAQTTAGARQETAPLLVATPAPEQPEERPRRRWWLWGALGAVVVGGAVTAVVLSTGGTTTIHDGSLATLRR